MKKTILLIAALLFTGSVFAQKTAFVNTETIFRAIPEYNKAIDEIDAFAQAEQEKIDTEFLVIGEMYERYQYQKQGLSETSRTQVEESIIQLERQATEKQAQIFGNDGELMIKRLQLLKPIQDRVFNVIDRIGQDKQYDAIIDISNNPSIVYYNKQNDLTQDVIKALGIAK